MSKKSIFPNIPNAIRQIFGAIGYIFKNLRGWVASLPDWGKLIVWTVATSILYFFLFLPIYENIQKQRELDMLYKEMKLKREREDKYEEEKKKSHEALMEQYRKQQEEDKRKQDELNKSLE
jgi:membrane protein insertase Oxa1/YidC/SpoIIIJ